VWRLVLSQRHAFGKTVGKEIAMRPKHLWKFFLLGFLIWFPLSIYIFYPLTFIGQNVCFWSNMILMGFAMFFYFDSRSLEEQLIDQREKEQNPH